MYFLCKENLPLAKFKPLMDFLKLLKVPNIELLQISDTINYTSHSSADDFLKAISSVIDDNITNKMKASPVITVFCDESTDISVSHKLTTSINVRLVNPITSLKPQTHFLTDVRLHEATGKNCHILFT